MAAQPLPLISPEHFDGKTFVRSGGSLAHSQICLGLAVALRLALRNTDYRVSNSDLLVQTSPQGPFVYPDASIYFGGPELGGDQKDALLNPVVVCEVMSSSTEGDDRGRKFSAYRRMPSLRDYVLVAENEARIDVFSREPNPFYTPDNHSPKDQWLLGEFLGLDAVCTIPSLNCEIPLSEVYFGIAFTTA